MDTKEEIYSIILNTDKTLVFTSETMARNTLSDFISTHPGRAVFKDRFISWDRFLLTLCDIKNKREVTDTERMAFVSLFIKKHGLGYLSYFVDSKYSESIPSFTRYISRILPYFPNKEISNLSFIDKRMKEDIEKIRPEYEEYLEERNLYEERYLDRDLSRIEKDKIVFVYPESFTSTFVDTIINTGKVEVIVIPETKTHLPLHEYKNSISEIKGVMRMVERDLESFPPSDIAITSSSLDTYRPYLEEEAKKRDIPLLFTSNLPLSSYREGKLLKLFFSLDKSHWGLKEFKKLVSDPSFPFKDRESLLLALRIGIDMKLDGGGYKNWMRAFDLAIKNNNKFQGASEAKALFQALYSSISLIVKAKKSLDTENRIRDFRDRFLQEGVWDEKNNRILGTALETLEGLKELEDENLYQIFLSVLKDTNYVENNGDENGVKVYSYPASAGLSIKHHYIIGLDDKTTSLKIDDYPFSQSTEKPEARDVGKTMLTLYANPDFAEFTYISGTSEGYDSSRLLPTIFLDNIVKVDSIDKDSYSEEFRDDTYRCTKSQSSSFLVAKNTVFKKKEKKNVSLTSSPLKLSVSDVKSWDVCPFKGYVQSILKLRKKEYECEMEDHFLKGDILHLTLENSLKEKHSLSNIDEETLLRHFNDAIRVSKEKGRIPNEAVESHIYGNLWRKLSKLKKANGLDYYIDKELLANEISFDNHVLDEDIKLIGRVDTVLKDDEGKLYILDYKLSAEGDWSKDNLDDMSLQVILYYFLITSDTAEKSIVIDDNNSLVVESGAFYSLNKNKFLVVWPTIGNQGFTFEAVLQNANDRITNILEYIKEGKITPDPNSDNCKNCDYMMLCRGRFVAK